MVLLGENKHIRQWFGKRTQCQVGTTSIDKSVAPHQKRKEKKTRVEQFSSSLASVQGQVGYAPPWPQWPVTQH